VTFDFQNMQISCNSGAELSPQEWSRKRPSQYFRPGIRFSIAVFHW
jgi:hypothetical protein